MAEIRFWDLARCEFPADVVQCSECCALVLEVNAGPHADWHEQSAGGNEINIPVRARNAATEGRIVLDEPAELGLFWGDGEELLVLKSDEIVAYAGGDYEMGADEADEWAAHLAGMAKALRAKAAAAPTPPAATPSAVLRRALEVLDGRDVVAAIRAASGNEQLADKAFLELAEFIGYGLADPAGAVALWQDAMPEHEIRRILPRAADHAEREGR